MAQPQTNEPQYAVDVARLTNVYDGALDALNGSTQLLVLQNNDMLTKLGPFVSLLAHDLQSPMKARSRMYLDKNRERVNRDKLRITIEVMAEDNLLMLSEYGDQLECLSYRVVGEPIHLNSDSKKLLDQLARYSSPYKSEIMVRLASTLMGVCDSLKLQLLNSLSRPVNSSIYFVKHRLSGFCRPQNVTLPGPRVVSVKNRSKSAKLFLRQCEIEKENYGTGILETEQDKIFTMIQAQVRNCARSLDYPTLSLCSDSEKMCVDSALAPIYDELFERLRPVWLGGSFDANRENMNYVELDMTATVNVNVRAARTRSPISFVLGRSRSRNRLARSKSRGRSRSRSYSRHRDTPMLPSK